jgi:predicted SAM-dependent methyltransferase
LISSDPRTEKRSRLAVWLKGDGIEIGALHRPLVVPVDAHVRYVDRLSGAALRAHYPELGGQEFAPVTILGDAMHLEAIPDESLDFVIANHLIEHLEYPIRGLREMLRVLRPTGILYAAIPDARVLEPERQLTTVEHLLDEHRNGAEATRRDHYRDWVVNFEKRVDGAEEHTSHLMEMDYSIHFHVWRSDTFLDFLIAARREACLDFDLVGFAPPEYPCDDELILLLCKGRSSTPALAPVRAVVAPPPPVPSPAAAPSLRTRVASSPLGPVLRPGYRLVRRWGAAVRGRQQARRAGAR